jgi:Putative Mg2+ and Co2+ transporter CorB
LSTNLIIALIAICLFFSALLSGSETAITYVPREKIHQLSDSKRNKKIKNAKDELEKTIGGILVANNFVNILMASLSTILFVNFLDGDETAGSALSTIVITLLVLIAGEITPKTIASRNPIGFLSKTAFIIDFLSRVFAPFTSLITKAIDNTSKDGDMDGDGEITEADIQALTALGEMEGQILPAKEKL